MGRFEYSKLGAAVGNSFPIDLEAIYKWREGTEGLYSGNALLAYSVYIAAVPHAGGTYELRSMVDGRVLASNGDNCYIQRILPDEEIVVLTSYSTDEDFSLSFDDAMSWLGNGYI